MIELNTEILVVGAGLTGLTTAFYLTKYGKNAIVLEKAGKIGGVIDSISEDGFIYETGPNSGVLSTIETVELFEDLKDLCSLEIANPAAKKRLIWKGSSWQPLPSGLISAVNTPLFTLKDKFRILGEPFRKPGTTPEESVADLVRRRLGQSFLNYAVDPFISGVYAGDAEKIITKYALPKLYNLEHDYGSFIGGSIKKMFSTNKTAKKATREVFSAANGLKNIIKALARDIGKDRIFTDSSDIKINLLDNSFKAEFQKNGEIFEITACKVITTIGAYALPELLPFIPKEEIDDIANLHYAKVVQVILGFKNWNGIKLDAFGGLVPTVEKRKILGILYSSSLFKNRAPENGALLSIFLGGTKNPTAITLSDDEIIEIVKNEIMQMMGLKEFNPDLLKIFRYEHAIPQYEVSSGKTFQRIEKIQAKYPGLILAGNIRNGIGMADRIKQGRNIADKL